MTPPPERAELAAALREVRQHTGLSLTGLEERTPFSRSSWGRYLKGDTLPPRDAVLALCRLAGEPDGRCLALWEIAEAAGSGRAAHAPARAPSHEAPREEADAPPPPEGTNGNRSLRVALAAAAVLAVLASLVTAAVLLTGGEAPDATAGATASSSDAAVVPPPRCRGASCAGKDPMNMLCGVDPDTLITYRTTAGARLELRHSPRCGTSWARMWSTRIGDRIELTAPGPPRSAEVTDELDARAYLYTAMARTAPGTVVRACFHPADGDAGRECFDARVR
ncbi:helix-turn-helix domain-containing protein [Streptomyces albogriseolus]|uniref:helix-turn-helix domain-containing protein n=1 Tax=Streptomyces albogriseolus TaxID=1887 RepID=UPI00225123B0|nr:XRE family transcriptional regulator [Streptomyces viridodiastaticus]MCX4621618.1 XRE family transcriptional regulator [Streptomyces viridodiastaticus]